jgi:hypothetical protein
MHVLLESSACCSPVLVVSSCWSCQCRFLFYELNIYAWCTFSRSYVTNCIHNIVPVKRMLACCRALLVAILVELQLRCRFFIESGTIEMCWRGRRHAGHVHVMVFTKLQVSHQLGHHVRLGFSRHSCTVLVISPLYGVQMKWSWMRWNRDDETLLLVLVPAPETSWNILCDHEKMFCHLFWAFSGLYRVGP